MAAALSLVSAPHAGAATAPGESAGPSVPSLVPTAARKINPTTVEVVLRDNKRVTFDFYGENIFRMFRDDTGGVIRDPEADPQARILVNTPRKGLGKLEVTEQGDRVIITTDLISVEVDKATSLMKVTNLKNRMVVLQEAKPIEFGKDKVAMTVKENPDEYFYGGGVQNGRFSHKGKVIDIENQNSWTDGGVASPVPFYWSTRGYGMMWYTFAQGRYDFGAGNEGLVRLEHETNHLDLFLMVDDNPAGLLGAYYQLTGNPVLLPKFGFYQGHLNAYNRDYWKEDEKGTLFEDGKRYKESQKDEEGTKESLNGENNNYQFSARAVIDRYKQHDMPLGWLLPNDGYGAGYGQGDSLDDNIRNLRSLADYAHKNGVEIGLWTQSDLHPKPDVSALLQRDIVKEVRDAGVRVLKTDVAWVGAGYSFGLNGVADAAGIMPYYGDNSRPFIISLDGWAGTQRHAGIWSGDQTGGVWEYIRFHIPTYIGSGLSGQPNISSDMDGIFGGRNMVVNTRDFQWKTFTPMELNMDGWGANEKYPHALGEPATSINRMYLKLKSELIPYTYSIAREAVDGLPMVRAMFLEHPDRHTMGTATRYQFLYGPGFLVAPIYRETRPDKEGNDLRNGIYLPDGTWIDYFTGEEYEGNRVINNFPCPLWKLPVFVKKGAIIPMAEAHNNVRELDKGKRAYDLYPSGRSSFTEYDDDGVTEAYKTGSGVSTLIESEVDGKGTVTVTIHPAKGDFDGFVREKSTELRVNLTEKPGRITAKLGTMEVKLGEAASMGEFEKGENLCYYEKSPDLNRFATPGSAFAQQVISKNPVLHVKLGKSDITTRTITLAVEGFQWKPANTQLASTGNLKAPAGKIANEDIGPYTLKPTWEKVPNADYYEIEFDHMLYSTVREQELLFEDLKAETSYAMKLRAVNQAGVSPWTNLTATTKSNPLEFAIKGITGETSVPNQGGSDIAKLFDFDEGNLWHTKWGEKAVPFEITADLGTINQVEKFQYLPRTGKGNGILLKGTIHTSMDKNNWTQAGTFDWENNESVKMFEFAERPTVRYLKIVVAAGVADFGSGRELYVFKVPGTASYLPGDINNDGKIDGNDLTSYINYTGLRKGDADFEGYISNGDINKNGLIDAYDISVVATRLGEGAKPVEGETVAGTLILDTPKHNYSAGEIVEITVKGQDLSAVNALSFALPYNQQDYEFSGIEPLNVNAMENMTNDRLHTNGMKALYPTFVNLGEQEGLKGSEALFVIKLKARKDVKFNLKPAEGLLADKRLTVHKF